MTPREPQPPGDVVQTTSHKEIRPRKEQEDAKTGQTRAQPQSGQDGTTKEGTQASVAGSSAQGPASYSKLLSAIRQFWSKHVSVVVELETCRDHLERTFLGYLRTGVVAATLGTVIAQLFVIQPSDSGFGYTAIGKPLAAACYCFAMCVTLLGALRVWRLQHALLLGKTLSGGFEIMTIAAGCLTLLVVFLGFLIAIDVAKESSDGPVDIECQCGVFLGEERRCGAALSCKRHSMGAKRAVAGRSAPFDQLLAASLEERF
ncbi:hypothetical protein LX32DRAFT_692837 [Colletotrichum zoysiae]|uniref:SCA7 domain-containing protein n=1 Tax=Colletotrichum zoysiae TaxID=1216348 RepID=A0AAD9HKT1_9PEZI|nr:hypothetical protein LX32DRAFT_692837 [Colletotrichum zoysiae]